MDGTNAGWGHPGGLPTNSTLICRSREVRSCLEVKKFDNNDNKGDDDDDDVHLTG